MILCPMSTVPYFTPDHGWIDQMLRLPSNEGLRTGEVAWLVGPTVTSEPPIKKALRQPYVSEAKVVQWRPPHSGSVESRWPLEEEQKSHTLVSSALTLPLHRHSEHPRATQ